MNRNILVTGGTGFLGKRFLDSVADSTDKFLVITRQKALKSSQNCRYLTADLEQAASLESIAPDLQDAEVLIDLAAMIPSRQNKDSFHAFLEANFNSHIHLLKQCGSKLKKIIYASTIDVYGPMLDHPHNEADATAPSTAYGATKLFMEHYYRLFCNEHNIELTILRFSQIYGPKEPIIKVIPIFIDRIMNNAPLKIVGSGEDLRRYLFIDDAVDAIRIALNSNKTGIYNVAGETPTSMNDLLDVLKKIAPNPL